MLSKITVKLGLDTETNAGCGNLTISESSPYPFLTISEQLNVIKLEPRADDEPAIYEDAKLYVFLKDYPETGFVQVPIKATIEACVVKKLYFDTTSLSLSYKIGSTPQVNMLPELRQEPSCQQVFDSFSLTQMSSSLTQEQFDSIVRLDSAKKSITFETQDFSILGKTILLKV